MARRRSQKGTFGTQRLPVAERYLTPQRRRRALLWAAAAALAVAGLAATDYLLLGGRHLSSGDLSSSHAAFEDECSNCHAPAARAASSERCAVCHEKVGDEVGVYSYTSHYLYRSDDFRRAVPSEGERACFACHPEHEGRGAAITRVPDGRCAGCHFAGFDDEHPEFEFAREAIADSDALAFPHVHHMREVMRREGVEELERACLYCHNPEPDGRGFGAIDFDRHCDACHLTATVGTPPLPVGEPADPAAPGVAPIEAILETRGVEARWALFVSPAEFRRRGERIVKVPLEHRDPWILDNLRALRRVLYPDAGLADLLTASAEAPAHALRELYEEAIAGLEQRALGLRGRPEPEIRRQLEAIEAAIERLRRTVREPFAPLDETEFALALEPDPSLSPERVAAIEELVGALTEPCQRCHRVAQATIRRVQDEQVVLRRAEFDHRAHIVQARCLDCHRGIPIAELVGGDAPVDAAVDRAEIQNLPTIATCRECHTRKLAGDDCVTCHLFHPDKSRRADLLLYMDGS